MASQLTLSYISGEETIPPELVAEGPPSEITKEGRVWYAVAHAPNRRKGSKISKIWRLGQQYIALDNPELIAWRCQLCNDTDALILLANKSTTSATKHLKRKHSDLPANVYEDSSDITTITSEGSRGYRSLVTTVDVDLFRYHLLRWIVKRQIPFDEVEDEDFQAMLLSLSQAIQPYIVQSSQTIRNWAQAEYEVARSQVRQIVREARSRIHISFDLWTSPNGYALCAICAHFVGSDIRNTTALLGLKRMKGPHGGDNIAEVIIPVLEEYGVTSRLGVFVADNAESNDTAIRAILTQLRPELNVASRRARCLGHIINLAAKAFLFGSDTEAFDEIAEQVTDDTPFDSKTMKDAQAAWRRKGAIGKFHNLVVFIRSSTQRREAFKQCVVGDSLIDSKSPCPQMICKKFQPAFCRSWHYWRHVNSV
jgi:hypothetical protein